MGWVMLAVLGAAAMAALVALRVARPLWSFVGAALMLGATGYALQQHAALPAHPAVPIVPPAADDAGLIDLRDRMLGRFSADGAYLIAADAMTRSGDDRAAVQVILGGIRTLPSSLALWTGLGSALAAHDGQRVSPPALFAFQQAARLAPDHPAPPFFLGLAYLRQGDVAATQILWRRAVALSPAGTSYRREIAARLALLDQLVAGERGRQTR